MALNNSINSSVTQGMHSEIVGGKYTLSNLRNASKYVVSSVSGEGGYTTIQSAIDQAVSDGADITTPAVIWIFSGTYNESLTLHPYINLCGQSNPDSVQINGNAIYSGLGNFGCSNVTFFSSNASASLSLQGSDAARIDLHFVKMSSGTEGGIAFECTGSDIQAQLIDCNLFSDAGGKCINISDGVIELSSSFSTFIDTQSTISGGSLRITSSDINDSFSLSSPAVVLIFNSSVDSTLTGDTCALIDTGATLAAYNTVFASNSVSDNFVTGIGIFDYCNISTFGTATEIDPGLTTSSLPLAGSQNITQQPSFNYYLSSTQTNVTGSGTTYTIPFDQIIFNKGGDFTAGVYTAPQDGNYLFTWGVTLDPSTVSTATTFTLVLNTTAAQYFGNSINPTTANPAANGLTVNGSVITSMTSGQTAQIDIIVYGLVADTISVLGNGAPVVTYFTGAMLN